MVLLTTISVPLVTIPPPLLPVLLPEIVLFEIVSAPVLEIPPPLLGEFPLAIVRPEMVAMTWLGVILKMRKLPAAALRCTLNRFAPGPLIVRFLLISNSPLVRLIVPDIRGKINRGAGGAAVAIA